MDLNDTPPSYLSISLNTQNNSFVDVPSNTKPPLQSREIECRETGLENESNYLSSPSIEALRQKWWYISFV